MKARQVVYTITSKSGWGYLNGAETDEGRTMIWWSQNFLDAKGFGNLESAKREYEKLSAHSHFTDKNPIIERFLLRPEEVKNQER